MPEGPEVKSVAVSLNDKIKDLFITQIEIDNLSRYHRNPSLQNSLDKLKFPLNILHVYSKGKKILFECVDLEGSKFYLVSALAMSGRWQYFKGKHSGIKMVLFKVTDKSLIHKYDLFFDDQRHFGSLIVTSEEDLHLYLKGVGPDLLSEDVGFDTYKSVITLPRLKNKEIGWFLLQQKYFSGIGNWIRAEILYECKIAPFRKLKELSDKDIENLYHWSIKILKDAFKVKGLTISNYIDPDGNYGTYNVKVYMRKKDPKGNTVITSRFSDKRTIHWVPEIQF
jgi:DNA-formamidopyrimidine glycosylase